MHHSEKRDFRRMTVETEASVTIAEQEYSMTCVDLSTTGARLICSSSLEFESGVTGTAEIQSGGGITPPLVVTFEVLRSTLSESGSTELAVRFTDMQ